MKPILIGSNNPYPGEPLYPQPKGCTGWRIYKMLKDRTGMTERKYLRTFDRRNLDTHGTKVPKGATVVLLGEDVRKAFGIPKLFLHPQRINGITYRQIPHPSGRCHFYNDPIQRELVAMMLEDLT